MDHFADEAPALEEAEGEEETDDDAPDRANRVGFYQEEEDIRGAEYEEVAAARVTKLFAFGLELCGAGV